MFWPSAEVRAGLGRDRPRTENIGAMERRVLTSVIRVFVELCFRGETINFGLIKLHP